MKTQENSSNSNSFLSIVTKDNQTIQVAKIEEKDYWSVCDFVVANEDRLLLFFPKTLAANLTPDLAKSFAVTKSKEFDTKQEFLFTIKIQRERKVIGLVYIKELDWNIKRGEFAYCIDYEFERKGITSKIITALTEHAFSVLGLKTLQIIVHKTNLPSVGVAKKCNFNWIKTLPEAYTPTNGKPMDMELYERYA
ncbi:GNAT family protein [Pseudotenacibaculum sp. MALMAid0570]|uniref:GNAT family N-acetyltransferase n=1 Tax=Pseudotenacibaculum sp. MALMAid0570 TaxID=3143938 RepID=UPI0032DEA784